MKQKVELVIINIIKVYFDFYRLFISDLTTKNGLKVKFIKAKDKVQAENKTADTVIALVKRGFNVDHTETQYLSKDKMYVGIIYVNPKLKAAPDQIKAVNGVK